MSSHLISTLQTDFNLRKQLNVNELHFFLKKPVLRDVFQCSSNWNFFPLALSASLPAFVWCCFYMLDMWLQVNKYTSYSFNKIIYLTKHLTLSCIRHEWLSKTTQTSHNKDISKLMDAPWCFVLTDVLLIYGLIVWKKMWPWEHIL